VFKWLYGVLPLCLRSAPGLTPGCSIAAQRPWGSRSHTCVQMPMLLKLRQCGEQCVSYANGHKTFKLTEPEFSSEISKSSSVVSPITGEIDTTVLSSLKHLQFHHHHHHHHHHCWRVSSQRVAYYASAPGEGIKRWCASDDVCLTSVCRVHRA